MVAFKSFLPTKETFLDTIMGMKLTLKFNCTDIRKPIAAPQGMRLVTAEISCRRLEDFLSLTL